MMEEEEGEDFLELDESEMPPIPFDEVSPEGLIGESAPTSYQEVLPTDENEKIEEHLATGSSKSIKPSSDKSVTTPSVKSFKSLESVRGEVAEGEELDQLEDTSKSKTSVLKDTLEPAPRSDKNLERSDLLNISTSTIRSLASTLSSSVLNTADKIQIQKMVDRLLNEAEELALHPSQSLFTSSQLGLTKKGGKLQPAGPRAEPYQRLQIIYEAGESEYASQIPSAMELYSLGIENGLTLNDYAWPRFAPEEPDQVYENLLVMTIVNDGLSVIQHEHVIMRRDHYETMTNKVKIIIGGCAGNEPLFSGYVGKGMATAAVIGDRRNSPKSLAIYKAIKELALHHSAGLLIMIPNDYYYRVVFGLAMERARSEGILIDMLVISDDCYDKVECKSGRRCLAGYVLALKVGGAMAEDERTLKEIYLMVQSLLITTISAHVNDGNIIMGTGIRDGGYEIKCPCLERGEDVLTQPFSDCSGHLHNKLREVVRTMMDYTTGYKRYFSLPLKPFAEIVLLVNCYTEDKLFLNSVVAEVLRQIYCQDVVVNRIYAGTFISSRRGFSISFLKVFSDDVFHWLDYSTSVEVWPCPRIPNNHPIVTKSICDLPLLSEKRCFGPKFTPQQRILIPFMLSYIVDELLQSEALLNELDTLKTFGGNIVKVAARVAAANKKQELDYTRPYNLLHQIAMIAEEVCYGADGSFLALFIGAMANEFLKFAESAPIEPCMIGQSLISGSEVIKLYCKIKPDTEAYVGDVCIPVGIYLINVSPSLPLEEMLNSTFVEAKKAVSEARFKPQGQHNKNREESRSVAFLFVLKAMIRARKKLAV